ncbi:hypothetical protein [Nonlabens sp.]|uniref:hypothetical protein n=1 Tax=Nonlabens sp. TaxID=1888209 RepID=UPI003266AC31
MKLISILFLLLFITPEQNSHKGIDITVRNERKSIVYVAENTTDKDIDLFFRVESSGFRRSADRPMITTIPAKKKLDLIELIPLKGADTLHSYMAIVTEKDNSMTFKKSDTVVKQVRREAPNGN